MLLEFRLSSSRIAWRCGLWWLVLSLRQIQTEQTRIWPPTLRAPVLYVQVVGLVSKMIDSPKRDVARHGPLEHHKFPPHMTSFKSYRNLLIHDVTSVICMIFNDSYDNGLHVIDVNSVKLWLAGL